VRPHHDTPLHLSPIPLYYSPMPLPPEIQDKINRNRDVHMPVKTSEGEKVVIEGKTSIPFGSFVKLILRRKVQKLFKDWQSEPVIIESELLTAIASAPEDPMEDKSKVIMSAVVIGFCFGMFLTGLALSLLNMAGITIGQAELLTGLAVLLAMAVAVHIASRIHTRKAKEQIVEKVEQIADLFAK